MKKNSYNVIGVMSGTSIDGIDLAYVNFTFSGSWTFEILAAETVPYSSEWQKALSEAISYKDQQLQELNSRYTDHLAEVISEFISQNDIFEIDAVCSHGHTIKHEPENGYTLQIGNLQKLATRLKQTVVCDFRVQDVQLGGQGAPLVPVGDAMLFPLYDYCLNLGGFANVSTKIHDARIAYDICAVNTVLNWLSNKIGFDYDRDGEIAASGSMDKELMEALDNLPFYKLMAPKSLGMEWVKEKIFPLFEGKEDIASALHTYTIHTGREIGRHLKEGRVIVTGGGAFNSFLMRQIMQNSSAEIFIPTSEIVDFKEALIFAFLGVLKLRGEVNVLSSVTGASKDHSSGVIFVPI